MLWFFFSYGTCTKICSCVCLSKSSQIDRAVRLRETDVAVGQQHVAEELVFLALAHTSASVPVVTESLYCFPRRFSLAAMTESRRNCWANSWLIPCEWCVSIFWRKLRFSGYSFGCQTWQEAPKGVRKCWETSELVSRASQNTCLKYVSAQSPAE